ncbi:transmembrane amino acid transporter protein-domain-containing protein [Pseudomassariella vexata]|uniref:Transmembrane amino acid transporter protein-domain-containing protein n=1 Tax=Pseudomassariella vexata TaxID=1141098 RepID=A0A1Y2EJK1_9PEZI|nr:transmembrane amino acid transporter protein-domain-containing protein [Pseudomassariella vexata]ORY71484.1 transmembrane amino acid transporter protein-domain-containing protein [Pseudomassariella vexata]
MATMTAESPNTLAGEKTSASSENFGDKKLHGKTESPNAPITEAEPSFTQEGDGLDINYRTLTWWQAGIIMIAETVSLGILSLPAVVANLGLAPGIALIVLMGILSSYSGLVLGDFRRKYPWVQSFGDAGEVMGRTIGMGRFFQELLGWAQTTFQIFVMGSHLLTWTICLNTLSDSSTCTIVWAFVGLAVFWVLNTPRTLKYASYMSFGSFFSIFTAVMMTVIDVAIERPIGSGSIDVSRQIGFTSAFLSVTNIAVAFSGHSCFFGVISEFKKPEEWPKALALLQICDTTIYLVAAVVIYFYVGPDVPSPALTAAGSLQIRKAIWGIAMPTIVIAGVIYGHIAAKYIFVRVFGGTKHIAKRTKLGAVGWFGITITVWFIALVIAESIPVFSNLLGLVCALFASWFSYGLPGILWLFMNKGEWFKNGKRIAGFCANMGLFLTGFILCIMGLWSSGEAMAADTTGAEPWSCKSNV